MYFLSKNIGVFVPGTIMSKKMEELLSKKLELLPLNYCIDLKENYAPFLQGKVTNAFTAINKKSHHQTDNEIGQSIFCVENLGSGTVFLNNTNENELTLSSSKLLDIITLQLTRILPYRASNEKLASFLDLDIHIQSLMELCGLKDKNQTVKQLKRDLKTLYNASTTACVQRHVGKRVVEEEVDIRFLDQIPHGQIRDVAHIRVALSFAKYLANNQIMYYPLSILLFSKNPNTYYIGKRLAALFNMNKEKSNKDSIKVECLLKYTPNIPSIEEECEKGRHYKTRCLEPLQKTLDELKAIGFLSEWYFSNSNKQKIEKEEFDKLNIGYTFVRILYVHY